MTVALVMVAKDEELVLERCLESVRPLINRWTFVDTGSTDETVKIVNRVLAGMSGCVVQRPWEGFGPSMTEALALARDTADWILRLDADMTVEAHPDLLAWLATDPDPTVDVWNVEIRDHGIRYRLPLLVRGGLDWEYVGATHEYLDAQGRGVRSLLGLPVTHHGDGSNREGKLERDLELLAEGTRAGDPRATFYTAETLRFLGRTDEAIRAYNNRAAMGGFEEERWFARYQSAYLRADVEGLLAAWRERPWRHEPLQAAAALVAAEGARDDILFVGVA
jgi:hypothetical protein